jgi:hypothetical protein
MKQKREVEEVICDICGKEGAYRQCVICGKDVCQNCNYELYKKKPPSEPQPQFTIWDTVTPSFYREDHEYLLTMCKGCYEIFIELSKRPTIIKAYEMLIEAKKT